MEESRKMNLTPFPVLEALGVTPLRLRSRIVEAPTTSAAAAAAPAGFDKRIAFLRSQTEVEQPTLATLYTRITEAISALGLQCVRMADAESDPRVRVLAFGEVALPPTLASSRVLRVDTLATLNVDRVRKRALWELMQKLARETGVA